MIWVKLLKNRAHGNDNTYIGASDVDYLRNPKNSINKGSFKGSDGEDKWEYETMDNLDYIETNYDGGSATIHADKIRFYVDKNWVIFDLKRPNYNA